MHLLSLLSPRMFKPVRIFLIFFWGFGFAWAIGVMLIFWFAAPVPEGLFADHPTLLRLLATIVALGFAGFFLYCLVRLLRMNPENMSTEQLQRLQQLQPLLELQERQRLLKAAEPIRKHEIPVTCPTCKAKFLLEESVTHAPPVCSFCGAHIPACT